MRCVLVSAIRQVSRAISLHASYSNRDTEKVSQDMAEVGLIASVRQCVLICHPSGLTHIVHNGSTSQADLPHTTAVQSWLPCFEGILIFSCS